MLHVSLPAEEIAIALKETFAKAMAQDPAEAANIARAMVGRTQGDLSLFFLPPQAVALASAGASAEDIARTMQVREQVRRKPKT